MVDVIDVMWDGMKEGDPARVKDRNAPIETFEQPS